MNKLPLIARILLGAIFFFFGLNGLFHFLPTPPLSGAVQAFFIGMAGTKYFFSLLFGVQVLSGLLLLIGDFVPLALVMLAPVIVNIFFFHLFLAHNGIPMALVVAALEIYLAFFAKPYSAVIKSLFRRKS